MSLLAETITPYSANGAEFVSEQVSAIWDYIWLAVMTAGLFRILCNIGALIAICCLFFFMAQFARGWIREEASLWKIEELIFPMIVVVLLSNGGTFLAGTIQGMRSLINSYNQQILASFQFEIGMEEALAAVGDFSSAEAQILALREQCNVLIAQAALTQCLEQQNEIAQAIVQQYQNQHTSSATTTWSASLGAMAQVGAMNPVTNPLQQAVDQVTAPVRDIIDAGRATVDAIKQLPQLANNIFLRAAEAILIACQAAFQYVIELSWITTAMIAPIALGLSLLPMGAKPIYAWLTGFFSLGMCKLCLNLITGIFAVMTVKLGPLDLLSNAIVVGFLAPVLALGMAAGGGMAIFQGLLAAGQFLGGVATAKR